MIRPQNGLLSLGKFKQGVRSLVPDFNIFYLIWEIFPKLNTPIFVLPFILGF